MTKPLAPLAVRLPVPPSSYDHQDQAELRRTIEQGIAGAMPRQPKQTVTGAKGGNAALTSLLTALANLGLIVDATT